MKPTSRRSTSARRSRAASPADLATIPAHDASPFNEAQAQVSPHDAIHRAFEKLGGWTALAAWVTESPKNREIFYSRIYPKLLSIEVKADVQVRAIAEIRFAGLND